MKLSVDKKLFYKYLSYVQGIVDTRPTMLILSHVLLEAKGGKLFLSSTDLESSVYTSFPANIIEEGSVCLPAKKIYEIVEKTPEGEIQIQTINDLQAQIDYKKGKTKIKTQNAEDFPQIPKPDDFVYRAIKSEKLDSLIKKTLYCIGSDDLRKNLTGIFFDMTQNGKIRLVSTDGHRMSLAEENIENSIVESFTLPKRASIELRKFIKDSEVINIGVGKNFFICDDGQTSLLARLVDVKFPDYKQVLPTSFKNTIKIEKKQLTEALQRASVVLQEKNKGVKIYIGENKMEIRSTSDDGETIEEVPVDKLTEPLDVGFNVKYLIDALSTYEEQEVCPSIGDEVSPACIFSSEDDRYRQLSVVMPMRV